MNLKLIKYIKCLKCGGHNLKLLFFDESGTRVIKAHDDASGRSTINGIMLCQCGCFYPVIGNIIRTIKSNSSSYIEFFSKFKSILDNLNLRLETPKLSANVKYAYDSFSYQWAMLQEKQNVWGISREDMLNNLEKQLLLKKEQMRDMIILDAGCGHGRVTSAFSKLCNNIVALEISESIDLAYDECDRKKNVLFIQGNVMDPPLVDESIDVIYCAGVLHHTPNTRIAAQALMPLLRKHGRFYIWLYPKRGFVYTSVLNSIRFFTSRVPKKILLLILKKAVVLFELWKKIKRENYYSNIRGREEIVISLFDCYSPRYRHTHFPEEVEQWFYEKNIKRVKLLHFSKYNLDMLAIKQ